MGRARGLPGGVVGAVPSQRRVAGAPRAAAAAGRLAGPGPCAGCCVRRGVLRVPSRSHGACSGRFPSNRNELKNAVQVALGALCRTQVKGASQAVAQARRALRHVCSREARPICRPRPRRPKSEYPFGTCALQTRRPRPDFNCGGPANTAATACSSRGASSPATGARRRRTRLGWIRTRRCRRRGRPLEASRTLMILRNKQLQ